MKSAWAYEVFNIFGGIYFWRLLHSSLPYTRDIYQIKPLSNLLNEVLHFGFTILLKQWAKEKR